MTKSLWRVQNRDGHIYYIYIDTYIYIYIQDAPRTPRACDRTPYAPWRWVATTTPDIGIYILYTYIYILVLALSNNWIGLCGSRSEVGLVRVLRSQLLIKEPERQRVREKEREKKRDRQAIEKTDRPTHWQTDRPTDRQTGRPTDRQTDIPTEW